MNEINSLRNSSDLVTIAQAFGRNNSGEVKTLQNDDFHVKARLRITNYAQDFIRGICSLCKKPTLAVYHKTYVCNHCNKQAISLRKFRIEVEISDRTDSIIATMSETAAEYFLGCKIDMLVQRLMEHGSFQSIAHPKCNIDMNIQLRRFENSRRGTITESFYILKIKRADNNEISEDIIDNIYTHEWLHDLEDVELTVQEKRVLEKLAQRKKPRHEVLSQVSSSIVWSSDTNIDRYKTADSKDAPSSSSTEGIGTQE